MKNEYLEQVMQAQCAVQEELKVAAKMPPAPMAGVRSRRAETTPGTAIDYRITGFWRWKTVVVPPNVYVVHTRRGHDKPVHVGLGLSFPFDPIRDSFVLVPAAIQTLLISASCICQERQGIVVQAYVQWIVDDVQTAYRKLDFSDLTDPMRIVNTQLREQAEAAIKDKVCTMSIEDILSDKQPVIEELTTRLKVVAEGAGQGGGLGLKIVTVQIKEAVVCSTSVWEDLQKPFRAERSKQAQMADIEAHREIAERQLQIRRATVTAEIETESKLADQRAQAERSQFDREEAERVRRARLAQEHERQAITERNTTELARKQAELDLALQALKLKAEENAQQIQLLQSQTSLIQAQSELERIRTEGELAVEDLRNLAASDQVVRELQHFQQRRAVENQLSQLHLAARLVDKLPEIARELPKPDELRNVMISKEGDGLSSGLVQLLAAARSLVPEAFGHKDPPR